MTVAPLTAGWTACLRVPGVRPEEELVLDLLEIARRPRPPRLLLRVSLRGLPRREPPARPARLPRRESRASRASRRPDGALTETRYFEVRLPSRLAPLGVVLGEGTAYSAFATKVAPRDRLEDLALLHQIADEILDAVPVRPDRPRRSCRRFEGGLLPRSFRGSGRSSRADRFLPSFLLPSPLRPDEELVEIRLPEVRASVCVWWPRVFSDSGKTTAWPFFTRATPFSRRPSSGGLIASSAKLSARSGALIFSRRSDGS